MLSFRNANPGDIDINRRVSEKGDLYVNRVVSENHGLVCKSEGLREQNITKEYFP